MLIQRLRSVRQQKVWMDYMTKDTLHKVVNCDMTAKMAEQCILHRPFVGQEQVGYNKQINVKLVFNQIHI